MIEFKPRKLDVLQEYLKTVPYGALRAALKAFTEYIIGNESHGLKHADPYRYVSRKSAYGAVSSDGAPDGYFSWKQFRYVAAITHGFKDNIGNNRTGTSTDAWQYIEVTPYNYTITNPEPGAYWTRSDEGQARQPAKVGWRKVADVIAKNTAGAIRSMNAAVSAYLKSKG